MLTDDATISMPPRPTWYRGREAVGAFLAEWPLSREPRWRVVPARANGQPAFGTYGWNAAKRMYVAHAIEVLTLADGGRISEIIAFLGPGLFRHFGLPDEVRR